MIQTCFDDFHNGDTDKVKTCYKCKKTKKIEEFYIDKKRKDGHQSKCIDCWKEYRKEHKEEIAANMSKWYQEHKEQQSEYYKEYNKTHTEETAKRNKEYLEKNKEQIYEHNLHYRRKNVDKINAHNKEAYINDREGWERRQLKYRTSDKGKECFRRMNYKRKQWGYNPLNEPFEGAEFHHLHKDLEGIEDHEIGLFLPKELHRSVYHNWQSWIGMDTINDLALKWYYSQKIITSVSSGDI